MSKIFYTPPGYTGTAELTASNGLTVIDQGRWSFSQAGYNDRATFGLSMGWPDKPVYGEYNYGGSPAPIPPLTGGILHLSATNWPIAVIGNELTDYTDPDTGLTYPAATCRIQVTGQWQVMRGQNSNSYNSFNVTYNATTSTDQGDRAMNPSLLNYVPGLVTYTIAGADVTGGARNTFSAHEFYVRATEAATSSNSNNEFQSNTVIRPVWAYTYTKSWEINA